MSAVRLTNDRVSAAVESVESLHLPMSVIFADGSEDLALITCYNGIHSSPDPFVILETGNKHTHSRHTCIQTPPIPPARQSSSVLTLCSDLSSVRVRMAEHTARLFPRKTLKALGYPFFIILNG